MDENGWFTDRGQPCVNPYEYPNVDLDRIRHNRPIIGDFPDHKDHKLDILHFEKNWA